MANPLSDRSTLKQLLFFSLGLVIHFVFRALGVYTPRASIFQPTEVVATGQSPAIFRFAVGVAHVMQLPAFVLALSICFLILAWLRRASPESWIYAILAGMDLPVALRLLFPAG